MGIFDILGKQKKEEQIDVDKDLKAIIEFFNNVNKNANNLLKLYKEYSRLRKQFIHLKATGASKIALGKNITNQIKLYDKILKNFRLFDLDADIAGERAKKIAKSLKLDAKKYKINKKWLNLVKKDDKWNFDW